MLQIGVLGINHKTAGIDVREKVAKAVSTNCHFFTFPFIILSTCNRTEIYFSASDLAIAHSAILANFRLQMGPFSEHYFYSLFHSDCFYHLCKVTAGLDSAVIGETEIQGQVKEAYLKAINVNSCLHFAFQKALHIGKQARKQGTQCHTLFSTIWEMAQNCPKENILFIGNSQINRSLATFLLQKKISQFSICTEHVSPFWKKARLYDRNVLKFWQQFDLIICATRSEGFLITGNGSPKNTIFDLSLPRVVDPLVGQSAALYNIEQVHKSMQVTDYQGDMFVRATAMRHAIAYKLKMQRGQESGEMESHREYSPCL